MRHIAIGWDGDFAGWNLKAAIVNSHGVLTDYAAGGFLDSTQFFSAIASGAYDPVMATGASALQTAVLRQVGERKFSGVTTFSLGAQHKLSRSGRECPSILSLGAEYDRYNYQLAFSSLFPVAGAASRVSRRTLTIRSAATTARCHSRRIGTIGGLFGEWLFPILKWN